MIITSNLDVMRQVAFGSSRVDFQKLQAMNGALL